MIIIIIYTVDWALKTTYLSIQWQLYLSTQWQLYLNPVATVSL